MRTLIFAALAVAALLLCLSCTTTTEGDGNGQNTILGKLHLFLDAWNSGDVGEYEDLLADDFTFYFDPMDVDYGLPESWGYEEEIAAFASLFDAVGAENVIVQLYLDGVTEPEERVDTYKVEEILYD
ncbi:MAG TPA: hypothetical protein ENN88_01690, partial [Candidatus Coatesbacteria bacterium]|nr:hypothetical protein [Candidatus Coatesbacteria bacterium]